MVEKLKKGEIKAPFAVISAEQYAGVGSRDNAWSGGEGNFFASFAIDLAQLPSDLPLPSASIYFSMIMKEILCASHPEIWLKWPNDFYLGEEKIGGAITQKVEDTLVCGMGINLKKSQNGYKGLDSFFSALPLLETYLERVEAFPQWKQVFREFEINFDSNRKFSAHIGNEKKSLSDAILCEDGSLILEGEKVFSLR